MSEAYAVYIQGISSLDFVDELDERTRISARNAVNRTLQKVRTEASREMRKQINWSAAYLISQNGKLNIQLSRDNQPEPSGKIFAPFRPSSLARFVSGAKVPWRAGVTLQVDPAKRTRSRRMMIVPLRRGATLTEDNQNLGLAIRLKAGETITGKYKTKEISKGLYLLYGVSVAQVFYTVAQDVSSDAAEWLAEEYQRQMNRKDL